MQNYVLKFVVIGDSQVGKSQLAKRFCKNTYNDNATSTVGLEFATKEIEFERCIVKAQVWDTAGQERFDSMTKAFYRDAVGAFLIFDVNNLNSLENLKKVWINQLKEFGYAGIKRVLIGIRKQMYNYLPYYQYHHHYHHHYHFHFHYSIIIAGNKTDVKGNVSKECRNAAIELAEAEGLDYYETSALSGEGVDAAFRRLILHVASLLPDVRLDLLSSYAHNFILFCFLFLFLFNLSIIETNMQLIRVQLTQCSYP